MLDFELPAYNAVGPSNPNVEIARCQFHFDQALIRHMHAKKLRDKYLAAADPDDDNAVAVRLNTCFLETFRQLNKWRDITRH